MSDTEHQCSFVGEDGDKCTGLVKQAGDPCFWHDPNAPRDMPDIKARLEEWVAAGHSLEGVVLQYANLEGFSPKPPEHIRQLNVKGADFYHANLRGARLVGLKLCGSNFMKADMVSANISGSDMRSVNLLSANLRMAKIDRVNWGTHLLQESQGYQFQREGYTEQAKECFAQAQEICRDILSVCSLMRLDRDASHFFLKQQKMSLNQMDRFSKDWWLSKTVELTCGYGERPARVVMVSILLIVGFAVMYLMEGVIGPDGRIEYHQSFPTDHVFRQFLTMLYFSVVTFTTLGYGDIYPVGWVTLIASLEAFLGSFMTALFVVVFVKKLLR